MGASASGPATPPRRVSAEPSRCDLFICPQGSHNADLARSLKSELEAMHPRAQIAVGGEGDAAALKPTVQSARCFLFLISSRDFASKAALRQAFYALKSGRRTVVVWDKEFLPQFPVVDGRTPLPAIEEAPDGEVRSALQRLLSGTALVFFRDPQFRSKGLRDIAARAELGAAGSDPDADPLLAGGDERESGGCGRCSCW